MIRLLAAVLSQNNPFFHSVQTDWRYTDSGPPELEIIYSASPRPTLPTDATPRTRSVLGGPSPRRRNASDFRRTLEAQGLGAHVSRRARTAAPRPRSTPPTSTWRFVSRCHISRGDPRSRTGVWAIHRFGGLSVSGDKSIYVVYVYIICKKFDEIT